MTRTDTSIIKSQYVCDRCGRIQDPPKGRWAWIKMQVDGVGDEETFPVGVGAADLCPDCLTRFKHWWNQSAPLPEPRLTSTSKTPAPPPPAMPFKARGGYTIPFAHRNSPQPPVRKIKLTRERRAKVKKALHALIGWPEYRRSKGWTGGLRYAQIMEACQFFSLHPITLRRRP